MAVGSLTIAGAVVFYLTGSDRQDAARLGEGLLAVHNDAVMTVLFLVFGVNLLAKGIPPLA